MEQLQEKYHKLIDMYSSKEFKVDVTKPDKNFNIFLTDLYNSYEDVEKIPGPPPEVIATEAKSFRQYLEKLNEMFDFSPWVLLAYLGILTAITGAVVDYAIVYVLNIRLSIIKTEESPILNFLVFYITGFILISVAASMGLKYSPAVDGSGIPELKSTLSGANTYKALDFNVFLPKIIGLIAAYGSGLAVGKVGPLVHLSAILANTLMKKQEFKHLGKNYAMKRSILSAAVACGVTCALGAPFGGIVFGIELTYGYFNASGVFKAFYATAWSMLTGKVLSYFIIIDPLSLTEFDPYKLDFDIVTFILLGGFIGVITVALLKSTVKIIHLRKVLKLKILERYPFVWLTYTVIVLMTYPFPYTSQSTRLFLNDAFTTKDIYENKKLGESPLLTLTWFIIIQWVSIVLTFACNMPFGILGPPMVLGAKAGRWFAEMTHLSGIFKVAQKGAYGVAGSAACIACVVRAIAPTIMLIETTGQIEYALPITITVLVSYIVGNAFSMSYFDVSMYMKKLPLMPSLMDKEKYEKRAQDLMNYQFEFLFEDACHKDVFVLFANLKEINKAVSIPILSKDGILVGSVKVDHLLEYLEDIHSHETKKMHEYIEYRKRSEIGSPSKRKDYHDYFDTFFMKTRTIYEKETNNEGDSRVVRPPSVLLKTFSTNIDAIIDEENDPNRQFWNEAVDWQHEKLMFDPSPLTVNPNCFSSKIQWLFTVTRVTCLYVTERGKLLGLISNAEFLKQKN